MEPVTTISLVSALTTTYEAGLANYIRWSRRLWRQNHYSGSDAFSSPEGQDDDTPPPGPSALRASLAVSGPRIREIYDRGFVLIGPQFSRGDGPSRDILSSQLSSLRSAVETLERSVKTPPSHRLPPLDLHSMLLISESVRSAVLHALVSQYARMAATRSLPKTLPGVRFPGVRMEVLEEQETSLPEGPCTRERDDDEDTMMPGDAINQVGIKYLTESYLEDRELELRKLVENNLADGSSNIRQGPVRAVKENGHCLWNEPPSPPPTPPNPITTGSTNIPCQIGDIRRKARSRDDDTERVAAFTMSAPSFPVDGPKNGVFSMFCPQVLSLQVDHSRPILTDTKCTYGYTWSPAGDERKGSDASSTPTSSHSNVSPVSSFTPRAPITIVKVCEQRDPQGRRKGSLGSIRSMENNDDAESVRLKEEFSLPTRSLDKSHCSGSNGLVCVLCTSAGRTGVYKDPDALREHLNESHDKWQMLHHWEVK